MAAQLWGNNPPASMNVIVVITYYYYDWAPLDVDNMAKPILDALKGVVYSDDDQVSDLISRKRDRNDDLLITGPTDVLLERLNRPGTFVHILVDNASSQEVTI